MEGNLDILIPAHGVYNLPTDDATVFFCVETSGIFSFRAKTGKKISVDKGQKIGSPNGKKFVRVAFKNDTATAIEATIYVGTEDYSNNQVSIPSAVTSLSQDAPSYPKGHDAETIEDGGEIVKTGLDGSNKRKQITVTNNSSPDDGHVLKIADGDDNVLDTLQPLDKWTVCSGGVFKIKNPEGNGVLAMNIGEIFFGTPPA